MTLKKYDNNGNKLYCLYNPFKYKYNKKTSEIKEDFGFGICHNNNVYYHTNKKK